MKSGASALILGIVKNGYWWQVDLSKVNQQRPVVNGIHSLEEKNWTDIEIARLVASGAVEIVGFGVQKPAALKIISKIRLAPKKGPKKYRLVINMRPLNAACRIRSCKYEGLSTALKMLQPGWWMMSLDLKEGYFHVGVHPDCQAYMGFFWRNKWYRYKVIPFGFSHSPWVFTKVIRHMIKRWRKMGLFTLAYLDDFILMAPTKEDA